MSSYARALRFILAQQSGKPSVKIVRSSTALKVQGKPIRLDVYTPPKYSSIPIVFLHGMSLLGVDDPRQIRAAEALAAAGFKVLCPELPEIRRLRIAAASIDSFVRVLSALLALPEYCPSGRVALFAPSFSGAICLRAAAVPDLADRISAVLALGSMSGIRASMEYLFLSPEADKYARYIVLANYLPLIKKYAALAPVFLALAHDNWNASAAANPQLHGFNATALAARALRKLTPRQKTQVQKLESDLVYRRQIFTELTPHMETELRAYDILSVASEIPAPVFLLHGSDDNVIPASESLQLAPRLKFHRLVVSPFLGHADTKVSLRLVGAVVRLISGLAYFFRHAGR